MAWLRRPKLYTFLAFLACCRVWPMFPGVEGVSQQDLYNLTRYLFTDYQLEVRPTTSGEFTYVYVQVYLLSIQALDERAQELESALIIEAQWEDDYLSWNTSDFGNVDYLLYQQKKVWLPDLVIENSVETQKQLGFDENKVRIEFTGRVIWKPSIVVKTGCDIDVTYYPFDTQTCKIILSTWMSTKNEIDIDPWSGSEGMVLTRYSDSGTWELISNQLDLLPDDGDLTRFQFTLKLKRLRTYYVLNIILPVLFLSLTASMVFYLPAEAGEKIGMGITVLLAYAVYLTIIADNMPQTSLQVSFLAVYLTVLLGITAWSVVMAVVVLHLHHKPGDSPVGSRTKAVTRAVRGALCLRRKKASKKESPRRSYADPQEVGLDGTFKNGIHHRFPRSKGGKVSPTHSDPETPTPPVEHNPKEEITWPKVAETLDRVLFFLTTFLILTVTLVFLIVLAVGD